MKPFPPYGRRLLEGPRESVTIIQGPDAFSIAKHLDFAGAMCVPPAEPAANYRWPVFGRTCHLIEFGECDDARVDATARTLLENGGLRVCATRCGLAGLVYTRLYTPRRVTECRAA